MKKMCSFKKIFLIVCLIFFSNPSRGAMSSGCDITDPAVLIQQVKSMENSVGAARLLKEMDLIIKELHAVINIETAPEIEDPGEENSGIFGQKKEQETKPKKKRNRDIELEMTIIPLEELQEWAKPLLVKRLKDKMKEAKVLNKDGEINYEDEDIVEKAREFTKEFLIPIKIINDETLREASHIETMIKRQESIQDAYVSASADAYAISMLAQYRLADFDEVVLTPFREDLEASEDLMDRFRKNTWAILGLMSQINMSNIRSATNLSMLTTTAMASMQDSDRVKRYQAKKEREEARK